MQMMHIDLPHTDMLLAGGESAYAFPGPEYGVIAPSPGLGVMQCSWGLLTGRCCTGKPSASKLGRFLVHAQFQGSVHSSALFLTAAAQNLLCLKLAGASVLNISHREHGSCQA